MKFIHTADWHMGIGLERVGKAGKQARQARFEAAARLMETARQQDADFVLIAGDLFDHNAVDGATIQKVADILGTAGLPIYVIPGNHDPLAPGSVWEHPAWRNSIVTIARESSPMEIPGGILFPCPTTSKYSPSDPTAWIQAGETEKICVGMAHGSLEGVANKTDFPIPPDAAARSGLDYLALGHWHSTVVLNDGHTAYSGTHEATKFGEPDSGNALIVNIEARGARPEITRLDTGVLKWERMEHDVIQTGDLRAITDMIETWEGAARTLMWMTLKGLLHPGMGQELHRVMELVEARFLWGRVDTDGLVPSPEDDSWVEDMPAGHLRKAAQELLIAAAGQSEDARVARLALLELYAMNREVER